MTKRIPRRLKAALELELTHRRQAEKDRTPFEIKDLEVAPLAHAISKGALHLEGVFSGTYEGSKGSTRLARLFKASFDAEGNLTAFQSIEAV